MATTYEVSLKWTGGAAASEAVRAADRVQAALGALERPAKVGGRVSEARRVAEEWQRIAARQSKIEDAERLRGSQAFARTEMDKRNAAFRRLMQQQRGEEQFNRYRIRLNQREFQASQRAASQRQRDEERFSRYRIRLNQKEFQAAQRIAAQRAKLADRQARGQGSAIAGGVSGLARGGLGVVGGAVGAAAIAAGSTAIDTAKLIENARIRLTAQLGSADAARNEIKDAFRIAEKTIFDPAQVLEAVTALSTNFKEADVRRYILGAVSDFATVSGKGSEGLDSSIRAINQIFAKGKVQQEELTGQLGELGLPARQVYAELAKVLNVTGKTEQDQTNKVIKLITAGKVDQTTGIQAITTVMRNLSGGGPAGEFAVKSGDSLEGILSNIRGGLSTLFATSDVDKWPALSSLRTMLQDVAKFFSVDSAAGQSFMKSIQSGLTADLIPSIERIHSAFMKITSDPAKLDALVRGITRLTSWIVDAAYVVGLLGTGFVMLWGLIAKLDEAIMDFVEEAFDAGVDLMKGLAQGIVGAGSWVYNAVAAVGSGMLNVLKAKLGIASPSKRGAELGGFFGEGVARGIMSGQAVVSQASAGLGSAAEDGFRPRAMVSQGARGGPSTASVQVSIVNNFTVQGNDDPARFAQEVGALVGPMLEKHATRYFGRLAAQGAG